MLAHTRYLRLIPNRCSETPPLVRLTPYVGDTTELAHKKRVFVLVDIRRRQRKVDVVAHFGERIFGIGKLGVGCCEEPQRDQLADMVGGTVG